MKACALGFHFFTELFKCFGRELRFDEIKHLVLFFFYMMTDVFLQNS